MNAQWVDEYVDMLLAPEATTPDAIVPVAAPSTPESHGQVDAPVGRDTHTAPPLVPAPTPARSAPMPPARTEARPAPGPVHARAEGPAGSPYLQDPTAAPQHEHDRRRDAEHGGNGGTRWLRVCVGGDSYALELLRVQEVLRPAPVVAMRGPPGWTLGVMNLRGRIVPVLDLGAWLGGRPVTASDAARIVVVERDDELIGILVSMVEDVVTLQRERRRVSATGPSGPTLIEEVALLTPARTESSHANAARGATVGVARVGSVPTVLLDASRLFD